MGVLNFLNFIGCIWDFKVDGEVIIVNVVGGVSGYLVINKDEMKLCIESD